MDTPTSFGSSAPFLQAMLIGLSIAAPVGQIGVLAIQRTLTQGRAAGLATGIGAALADAVYGLIGALGVSSLISVLLQLRPWLILAGSGFLFWLAWRIARAPLARGSTTAAPSGRWLGHVWTTFALTLANPTTILSFMAVFSALAGQTQHSSPLQMVSGVLLGSALWWLILASLVDRLRHRFDARWQRRISLASAGMLAGLALWQLWLLLQG